MLKVAEEKRVVSRTSRGLIILSVLLTVVIAILILSGFRKVNPYLLLAAVLGGGAAVWHYFRKPKEHDIYSMLDSIKMGEYKKRGHFSDTADFIATPLTNEITELYLPNEGMTYEISSNLVRGLLPRHLYKVVKEKDKSRLFDVSQRVLGAEAKVKQAAESLNVDVAELGLNE